MHGLEIRFYDKGEDIVNEMDESLEVLFVESGRYEVGYAVNNKRSFQASFGVSTIIGGFQICYNKRHNFIYRAETNIKCLAIRKQKFNSILNDFPEFKLWIKQKLFMHYS